MGLTVCSRWSECCFRDMCVSVLLSSPAYLRRRWCHTFLHYSIQIIASPLLRALRVSHGWFRGTKAQRLLLRSTFSCSLLNSCHCYWISGLVSWGHFLTKQQRLFHYSLHVASFLTPHAFSLLSGRHTASQRPRSGSIQAGFWGQVEELLSKTGDQRLRTRPRKSQVCLSVIKHAEGYLLLTRARNVD